MIFIKEARIIQGEKGFSIKSDGTIGYSNHKRNYSQPLAGILKGLKLVIVDYGLCHFCKKDRNSSHQINNQWKSFVSISKD